MADFTSLADELRKISERVHLDFNLFSILRKDTDEEHLHSRFIAELLDPCGTHDCKNLFLDLFLRKLNGLKPFGYEKMPDSAIVVHREFNIGPIDEVKITGGVIDIFIHCGSRFSIVIENKINAREQTKQLQRYYNSLKNYPNLNVFYLTLHDNDSSEEFKDYTKISYHKFIIEWLKECAQSVESKADSPVKSLVLSSIRQYASLIERLSGNTPDRSEWEKAFIDIRGKFCEKVKSEISKKYKPDNFPFNNFLWEHKDESNAYYWVQYQRDEKPLPLWLTLQIFERSHVYNVGLWAYQETIIQNEIKSYAYDDGIIYKKWIHCDSGSGFLLSFDPDNFERNYRYYSDEKYLQETADAIVKLFTKYFNDNQQRVEEAAVSIRKHQGC